MGHIIPLLEFAKRLVQHHGVRATFFLISTDASAAQNDLRHSTSLPAGLNIVEIPEIDTSGIFNDDMKIVTRISANVGASIKLLPAIIKRLPDLPKALVIDLFCTQAFDVLKELSIPIFSFWTASTCLLALSLYLPTLDREVDGEFVDLPGPIRAPGCNPIRPKDLIDQLTNRKIEEYKWYYYHVSRLPLAAGIFVNSWEDVEPVDLRALKENAFFQSIPIPRVIPIGPLIKQDEAVNGNGAEILAWLDDQPRESVLFVAFGSGGSLSTKQLTELAWGLEMSQQRFILVAPTTEMIRYSTCRKEVGVAVRPAPAAGEEVIGRAEIERVVRLAMEGKEAIAMKLRVKELKDSALVALNEVVHCYKLRRHSRGTHLHLNSSYVQNSINLTLNLRDPILYGISTDRPESMADSKTTKDVNGSAQVETRESIEELEKKYGPYVRRDSYGVMGRGELPWTEKALLAIALVVLLPLRVVAATTFVVICNLSCRIATAFWSPSGEDDDYAHLSGWRRSIIMRASKFAGRALLFSFGFYRIHETHREHCVTRANLNDQEQIKEGERAGVIVSNHISYVDILYHMSSSAASFVAKESVANLPLVGLVSKCLGCIYVKREDKSSQLKGVSGMVNQRIQEAHQSKSSPMMVLFPEGTTTNGDFLLPFKTGAFLSKAPVRPVIIRYTYQRLSPAWDSISGARHLILLLCQFVNNMEVIWLPVYYPTQQEKDDPKLYAENVRKFMADEGCLILSDIGLAEKREYHAALNGKKSTPIVYHKKDD
nr:lysophospholipid acyltransferase LPEAT1 isoform X1 [Ipomoea batatas]